jgi:hypothetical protein
LPTAKIDERKLKRIILQAKKRWPKIKDFMVKYWKATWAAVAKSSKAIVKWWPSLAAWLASDMAMWNIEIPQQDWTTKKLKDIPKFWALKLIKIRGEFMKSNQKLLKDNKCFNSKCPYCTTNNTCGSNLKCCNLNQSKANLWLPQSY